MSYSVIIPAYNEEKSISSILSMLVKTLDSFGKRYEIIVVNDCSTDKTRDEVVSTNLPVTLVEHSHNRGYGATLKTGIKRAQYDWIVITDSDGTYPNDMIPELVSTAIDGSHDMVVGARTGAKVNIPLIRKPAKWFITKLASYLTATNIPDLNSGLRVMRKNVVEKFANILPDGFSFTSTITMAMLSNGYSVKYIPIDYFKRSGKSKIRPIYDTANFIQLILRTSLYFNPLKVFLPLSFLLMLLAFFVLIVSFLLTGKAMDVTFGIIIMTSIVVIVVGMLADLIDKRLK